MHPVCQWRPRTAITRTSKASSSIRSERSSLPSTYERSCVIGQKCVLLCYCELTWHVQNPVFAPADQTIATQRLPREDDLSLNSASSASANNTTSNTASNSAAPAADNKHLLALRENTNRNSHFYRPFSDRVVEPVIVDPTTNTANFSSADLTFASVQSKYVG